MNIKFRTDFVSVYSNEVDSKHIVDLINQIDAGPYKFENFDRRPHDTMALPNWFDAQDNYAAIELRNIFHAVAEKPILNYASVKKLSGIEPQKTYITVSRLQPNREMPIHQDTADGSHSFICMIYLNNDYLGGELFFPEHNFTYRPEAGDVVIYQMTEPHAVKEVSEGLRYSIGCGFSAVQSQYI